VNKNFSSTGKPQPRRLNAEEIELWLDVTREVARRPGSHLLEHPQANQDPPVDFDGTARQAPGTEFQASLARRGAPPAIAPLERRLRQKLARGQAAPDAAIDLHGMHRQQAYLALRAFLTRAQTEGARLVLVVTGKGDRPASGGATPGILRQSVPHWLRAVEYSSIVAGFEEAARPHGGAGALFVRLSRRDRPVRGTPSP